MAGALEPMGAGLPLGGRPGFPTEERPGDERRPSINCLFPSRAGARTPLRLSAHRSVTGGPLTFQRHLPDEKDKRRLKRQVQPERER